MEDKMKKKIREKIAKIFCAMFRHSMIQDQCFGYFYCGRCSDQVGDSLASVYSAENVVVINHNCKRCLTNYKSCTWIDKFMVPWPFKKEE